MNPHYLYRIIDKDSLRYAWSHMKPSDWFCKSERETYSTFGDKRREEWILTRFLAKQVILESVNNRLCRPRLFRPSEIQICSRNGIGGLTRPRILVDGRLINLPFSIAHSQQSVLVALSNNPRMSIGADIELIQKHSTVFSKTWFTKYEQNWVQTQGKAHFASMLWAIKEAAYKAINTNNRFMPDTIEVRFNKSGECSLLFDGKKLEQEHNVYFAEIDNQVMIIVTVYTHNLDKKQ